MHQKIEKKVELLSPAGSFDALKAVAEAGADAVYAAGQKFGARAYAANLTDEELLEAIDYLHLKGKCFYLTVNTLLKDPEIRELQDYLKPLYEAGLDAVIVQDMGVLHTVREHFPLLPIHASTQMAITGAHGAKLMLEAGCSRIVTARELSLEEIAHIHAETGAEIESFVHGALCYCYSGQCLLSSMIGGRSGNRGRCAQPCRLPYRLSGMKEGPTKDHQGEYLLSMKDLCAIDLLPQLIESGVYSFKIEGRMKQAEYAAGVTRIYRKYLDQLTLSPDQEYRVAKEDREQLLDLGNRCGFTDGYFTRRNGKEMVTFTKPSHEKGKRSLKAPKTGKGDRALKGQELEETGLRERQVQLNGLEPEGAKEKIKGILRLYQGTPAQLVVQYKDIQVEANGQQVQPALKQPLLGQAVIEKMQKTGNTPFEFEEFRLEMDENVFLSVGAINQLRREGMELLQEEILKKYRRPAGTPEVQQGEALENYRRPAGIPEVQRGEALEKNRKPAGTPEVQQEVHNKLKGHLNLKENLGLRILAGTPEQFQAALGQQGAARIYLESSAFPRVSLPQQFKGLARKAQGSGKECYLALPYVFRMETARWFSGNWQEIAKAGADGYLVRNYEEIQFLKEMGVSPECVQGDYGIYGYSKEALQGLSQFPFRQRTLPAELNFKELKGIGCEGGELVVYGYQPVMVSSQCLWKNTSGCTHKSGISYLKDRFGKQFPVQSQCGDCYNIIYNTSPLSLLHHLPEIRTLNPAGARLSFTVESREETEYVLACYRKAISSHTASGEKYFEEYTNGHFTRGIE